MPRVVESEPFEIGDGVERRAWVVELDWWGMGAAVTTFTSGGGVNGSAAQNGKFWVLKGPPAGVPPVVRIQTEAALTVDRVNQLQDVGRD